MGRSLNGVVFLTVLLVVCLAHRSSAQGNWWDKLVNPSSTTRGITGTTVTTPTTTTTTTTTTPTQGTTNCPCPTTPEYNPVCGDNRVTYANPRKLKCAQDCGERVQLLFYGACQPLL